MKKREILYIIKNLEKKNNEVLKDKASKVDMTTELAECQQKALEIGNDIEKRGNSSQQVILLLEEYCEQLYQISQSLENDKICRKYQKRIAHLLNKIANSIKYHLAPDKKKIVFMPYKVSMWDSMESIWKAAEEDSDCESYVVPIPYFDRTSDGKLGIMHYEGDLYPEYVPVISWKEYSLNEHRPDVIFIHNPYDEYNYVTSVHPAFYSKILKKYTDILVYIPYFYTNKIYPDAHISLLPAYIYSDFIIVQNEIVRKQLKKIGIEKKVIALGSPKLDCILKYQQEKRYPKELEKYRGKKRIVLFNTSISFFLSDSDFALRKINYIFRIFSKQQDILVVWRPHPLLEATIKSMRPKEYELFLECRKEFQKIKNGVLDEGMNPDELVVAADAYVGEEESSMVVLFASLGKPIYILNKKKVFADYKNENFFDFYHDGKYVYFVHGCIKAICKADGITGEILKVFPIESDHMDIVRSYTQVADYNGKLYFTPMNAENIVEFDIKTETIKQIAVKNPKMPNYNRVLKIKDSLWFISTLNEALLRYECTSGKMEYYEKPIKAIKKNAKERGYFSMFASCAVQDNIYIAAPTSNIIIKYDTTDDKVSEFTVGKKNNGYWHMLYDGQDLWMIPYKGRAIVRWNPQSLHVDEYDEYPEDFQQLEQDKDYFIQLADCDTFLLAFPKCANMIIKIDKKTGKLTQYRLELSYQEGKRKSEDYAWGSNYFFVKREENLIFALSAYDYSLLTIDLDTQKSRITYFRLSEKSKGALSSLTYEKQSEKSLNLGDYFYREDKINSLEGFLYLLAGNKIGFCEMEQKALLRNMDNSDGSAGKKIFAYFREDF